MLLYGREERLPISLEFLSLELAHQLEIIEDSDMTIKMEEFIELEEKRHQAMQILETHQ